MSYSEVLMPTASLLSPQGLLFINEVSRTHKHQKTLFIQEKPNEVWVPQQNLFASEIAECIKRFSDFCILARQQPWAFIIANTCVDTHWEFSLACSHQYQFQEQITGWSHLGPYDPYNQIKKIFFKTNNKPKQLNFNTKSTIVPAQYSSIDKKLLPYVFNDFLESSVKKWSLKKTHMTPQILDSDMTSPQLKKNTQNDENQYFYACAYSLLKIRASSSLKKIETSLSPHTFALDVTATLPPRDILKYFLKIGHQIFLYCADQVLLQQRLESALRKIDHPDLFSKVLWGSKKPTQNVTHLTWHQTQTLTIQLQKDIHLSIGFPGNHQVDHLVLETHNQDNIPQDLSKKIPNILDTQTEFKIPFTHHIRILFINEIIECSKFFQNEMHLVMNILQNLTHWHFLNDPNAWEHLLLHWGHQIEDSNFINTKNHIQGLDRWSQIKKTCFHKQRSHHWNQTELVQHLYLFSEFLKQICLQKKWITEDNTGYFWGSITGIPQHEQTSYINTCGEKRFLWETQLRWPQKKPVA